MFNSGKCPYSVIHVGFIAAFPLHSVILFPQPQRMNGPWTNASMTPIGRSLMACPARPILKYRGSTYHLHTTGKTMLQCCLSDTIQLETSQATSTTKQTRYNNVSSRVILSIQHPLMLIYCKCYQCLEEVYCVDRCLAFKTSQTNEFVLQS